MSLISLLQSGQAIVGYVVTIVPIDAATFAGLAGGSPYNKQPSSANPNQHALTNGWHDHCCQP